MQCRSGADKSYVFATTSLDLIALFIPTSGIAHWLASPGDSLNGRQRISRGARLLGGPINTAHPRPSTPTLPPGTTRRVALFSISPLCSNFLRGKHSSPIL